MKNELYLTYMCWLFVQMYNYFVMKSLNKYIIFKERTGLSICDMQLGTYASERS